MKNILIVGVSRGDEFSPNHIDNDAAIFDKVACALREAGFKVNTYTEREFVERKIETRIIFNMARHRTTIARLQELESKGTLVINSAFGIDNCVRRPMTELLIKYGIPHPKSYVISTGEAFEGECFPCWIKRGDSHAMVKDDVCYVTSREEACFVINEFENRKIPVAVVNEHLKGDLIKFYGVQQTGFFYWFYPSPESHSKFGLEIINGAAQGIPFSETDLKWYCEQASVALNVPVYGGDCIVSANGEMKIIDFNDWPSFARCREEAGQNIAVYIINQVIGKINKIK